MAPRACLGFVANAEGEATDPCVFNGNGTGRPARALTHGRCVWCCPEEMNRRLASPKLEKFLIYTLVNFKSANGEVFEKTTGRLPEQRQTDILAEVDARLEPEEEGVPGVEEAEVETEKDERDETEFAALGVVADSPNDGEGELDIDAVDVGEVDFGDALGECDAPFEPAEDAEAEQAEEAALKKRRLRGRQAAPVKTDFGNPLDNVNSPFEFLGQEQEEAEEEERAEEAAPKKRRLRGKQAAPIYGPPAAAAVFALASAAPRRRAAAARPGQQPQVSRTRGSCLRVV